MEPGRASETARRVAAFRRTFDRPAGPPGGDPAADDALAGNVADGIEVDRSSRMAEYLRGRTAFVDSTVLRCLDEGIAQVVVIGAGYDARALRYRRPGVTWFELDHPDTQADKRARLAALRLDASDVAFVAIDLGAGADLAAALAAVGHRADEPTLAIWEGVVNYLEEPAVRATASALRRTMAPGSRLAVTVATDTTVEERARFERTVAALGEPAGDQLGVEAMRALLDDTGWTTIRPAPRAAAADPDPLDERLRRGGLLLAITSDRRPAHAPG